MSTVTEWRNDDGKFHRTDGPAVVSPNGKYKHWYVDGLTHRTDGPAIIRDTSGIEIWCEHGRYHRLGAPAIIQNFQGRTIVEWWVDGTQFTFDDYIETLMQHFGYTQSEVDGMEVIIKLQYGTTIGIPL